MTFRLDGDLVRAEFVSQSQHQGYDGVVHGGILAAVLDDAMANCLWLRGIAAVTGKMTLRYRAPVPIGTPLHVYGRLVEERRRFALAEGWLTRADDTRLVEASGSFFKLPQDHET